MITQRLVWNLLLAVAVIAAFWRGGRDEQAAAGMMFAASLPTPWLLDDGFVHAELGVALIDLALLAGLGWVMVRSNRYWPILAVGAHANGTFIHVIIWLMPAFAPRTYFSTVVFWSYAAVLALLLGIALERRRWT